MNYHLLDGHLIRVVGDNKTYFVLDGQARWIMNPQVFESIFKLEAWNAVVEFDKATIDQFPKGDHISSPALMQDKNGYKVYFVPSTTGTAKKRHWVINPESYNACMFKDRTRDTDVEGSQYTDGGDLSYRDYLAFYRKFNGHLIRFYSSDGGKVYFVLDGRARWIVNPTAFDRIFRNDAWETVIDLDPALLQGFPKGEDISTPALMKNPSGRKVYFAPSTTGSSKKRHWVVNPETYNTCRFKERTDDPSIESSDYTDGADLTYGEYSSAFTKLNGRLIRCPGDEKIYFVFGGKARLIVNSKVFDSIFKAEARNAVVELGKATIEQLPKGDDISSPAIMKHPKGKKVYFIPSTAAGGSARKRHWIVDPQTYNACKFKERTNDPAVDNYTDGLDLTYGNYDPNYNRYEFVHDVAQDWMRLIPGNTKMYEMSIPATHDCVMWDENMPAPAVLKPCAKCQYHPIDRQFNYGIRGYDLRIYWDEKKKRILMAHNNYDARQTFASVFAMLVSKIREYPTEFIIADIIIERDIDKDVADDYRKEVLSILQQYRDYIYIDPFDAVNRRDPAQLPTLDALRGKVFIRSQPDGYRGNKFSGGVAGDPWRCRYLPGGGERLLKPDGCLRDTYMESPGMKGDTARFEETIKKYSNYKDDKATPTSSRRLLYAVCTASSDTDPLAGAKKANPAGAKFLRDHPLLNRTGVVYMDFINDNDSLSWEVLKVNPTIRSYLKSIGRL